MGKKNSAWEGVSHSPAATAMQESPSANPQLQSLRMETKKKDNFPYPDLVKSTSEV